MAGSGKTILSKWLHSLGLPMVRFGDVVINEVLRRGLEVTSLNEQSVREELRHKGGMDVCAKLSLPGIYEQLRTQRPVIVDGLYSFSEYKTLRAEFGDGMLVVAVFTSRDLRYARLTSRAERPLTVHEAKARDYAEIENIEKGGPIALADHTLLNNGSKDDLIGHAQDLFTPVLENLGSLK